METDIIGKWGGVNLNSIIQYKQKEYVHPEDWHIVENYPYAMSKHLCIGIDGQYAILQFGRYVFRVLAKIFHPSITPKFKPFTQVKFYNSKGQLEFGIIKGIYWHNNDQKHVYSIEANGKLKSRRYYDEDLESVEN